VQRTVTALRVHGGFYDIFRLAVVFLRELGDGGLEVFDFVDAGEVEDVVDLVCCESGGVCGRHDGCVCTWVYTSIYLIFTSFLIHLSSVWEVLRDLRHLFFNRGVFFWADRSGRWLCLNGFVGRAGVFVCTT
jgi:hypothetical protein